MGSDVCLSDNDWWVRLARPIFAEQRAVLRATREQVVLDKRRAEIEVIAKPRAPAPLSVSYIHLSLPMFFSF